MAAGVSETTSSTSMVATEVAEEHLSESEVATVQGPRRLVTNDPLIVVDSLLGENRLLSALIDTAISFLS